MRAVRTASAKRWIALGLVAAAAIAVAAGIYALGLVTEKAGTGAVPADAFNEIPELPEAFEDLVTWSPDQPLNREVEPATRRLVEAAWVKAFSRVDEAQRTGARAGTEVWFVGGLHDQAASTARSHRPAALFQHQHELEVTFYSVDGSIMAIDATSDLERSLFDGPTLRSTDTFEAVFLLSDGNWRLQHLRRR